MRAEESIVVAEETRGFNRVVLTRKDILERLGDGRLEMDPVEFGRVEKNSVLVGVKGDYYWRQRTEREWRNLGVGEGLFCVNPYDSEDLQRMWVKEDGAMDKKKFEEWVGKEMKGMQDGVKIIPLMPNSIILAQADVRIGGKGVLPVLQTRSTFKRLNVDVCGSSAFGDEGYRGYYTLEIHNANPFVIPLVVGEFPAKLYLLPVEGVDDDGVERRYGNCVDAEALLPRPRIESVTIFERKDES